MRPLNLAETLGNLSMLPFNGRLMDGNIVMPCELFFSDSHV